MSEVKCKICGTSTDVHAVLNKQQNGVMLVCFYCEAYLGAYVLTDDGIEKVIDGDGDAD